MTEQSFLLPDEPIRFNLDDLNRLLIHCADLNASDVTLKSGEFGFIQRYGRYHRVTRRPLSNTEVGEMVNAIYGANGTSRIGGAKEVDTAHEIKLDRNTRLRFRVNATGCMVDGGLGIEITMRVITAMPPHISTLNLEKQVLDALVPQQGMVLIVGETGSGKSTLLASNIRNVIEDPESHKKILTYEAPIEYVYDDVERSTALVTQTEIPRNLPSFEAGVRNCLRRNPSIVLIGEARDRETIEQSVVAANTGHLLYTTVHANGVAETLRRLANAFPDGERDAKIVDILESLRLIIAQRLIKSRDGKRIALREFLVFDSDVRNQIYSEPFDRMPVIARRLVQERGQPMMQAAINKFNDGMISEFELDAIRRAYGGQHVA